MLTKRGIERLVIKKSIIFLSLGIAISAPKSDKWFELNQYLTANVIYKENMYKHSMRVYVDERTNADNIS